MALHLDIKKEYFNGFLKDENNNIEAVSDCSQEMEEFSFKNTNNKKLFITKLVIAIEDNHKFKFNKFASDIDLTNGLKCYFTSGNVKNYIISDTLPIKKNSDWIHYSCDIEQLCWTPNVWRGAKDAGRRLSTCGSSGGLSV